MSRSLTTKRHRTAYVEAGPADGPLILLLHGHSELSSVLRGQIEHLAADGWHCVTPDMRGYGGLSAPESSEAYMMREMAMDMTELHDALGRVPAVWVRHDFRATVVWQLGATEGPCCRALVNLNLPYFPVGVGPIPTVPYVDRRFSRLDRHLLGQRDYMQFHTASTVVDAFDRNGSSDSNTWCHNEVANQAFAQKAPNGGRLTFPMLYFHARYDLVVDTLNSRLAEPMRAACADLTEETFGACRCPLKERASEVNGAIENWLVAKRIS